MTEMRWIGPDDALAVGDFGFLINQSNACSGRDNWWLSPLPARENVSGQPRLDGWCGSWNDTATHAAGVVAVEKIARNGRALVRELAGDDLEAALELLGFPDLMPTE